MTQTELITKMVRKKRMEIEARSRFDNKNYVDPGVDCSKDEVLTKQSFKDECDINKILSKYEPGMIQPSGQMVYVDAHDLVSYEEAQRIVLSAEGQFMALDAKIRAKFDNSPAKFLDFVTNENNLEEMRALGLAKAAVAASSESSGVVPTEGSK